MNMNCHLSYRSPKHFADCHGLGLSRSSGAATHAAQPLRLGSTGEWRQLRQQSQGPTARGDGAAGTAGWNA